MLAAPLVPSRVCKPQRGAGLASHPAPESSGFEEVWGKDPVIPRETGVIHRHENTSAFPGGLLPMLCPGSTAAGASRTRGLALHPEHHLVPSYPQREQGHWKSGGI